MQLMYNLIMKKISLELLNKLANYMATKPYIETAQLIAEISNLPDVEEQNVAEPKAVEPTI